MNIKRAKQEIKNALRAYLAKDEFGAWRIPPIRQRPVLLIGPPGIGKTQIMQQIAEETGVGLVSYTLTHHTRQSALGLPFIEKVRLGGEERTVTSYTMSEIIASVYREIERTGVSEGILFLDEINCISETLTPMMLQFLQCKTFGNQQLPAGWMVVAAGNPPEYNKSVREFDVVTLDRVKKIDIEEDFGVWKEYAGKRGIHGAILSYLEIRRDNFYRVEATADGLQFVTARGWEDLSELMQTYETLGLPVDRQVVEQYLQLPQIASDFANYLQLYEKYRQVYRVDEIVSGTWEKVRASELRDAPFDEKLGVLGLLLSRLADTARAAYRQAARRETRGADAPPQRLDRPGRAVRRSARGGAAGYLAADACARKNAARSGVRPAQDAVRRRGRGARTGGRPRRRGADERLRLSRCGHSGFAGARAVRHRADRELVHVVVHPEFRLRRLLCAQQKAAVRRHARAAFTGY